jgi:hypothetical protein
MPRGETPVMIAGRGLKGLNLLAIWAERQELIEAGLNS